MTMPEPPDTPDLRPAKIYGVSLGMFSIAKHYGCVNINGDMYVYDADDDTLTRADLVDRDKFAEIERKKWICVK